MKDQNASKIQMNKNIKGLQCTLFTMLLEINRICQKHDIKYSLFAGTALGAIRHNGFIPWDDDLDIIMPRADYDKFLEVAPDELSNDYFLQKEFSEHWPMFFTKLRKNNTSFIEKVVPKDFKQHQGIYIDIFPCDNLSDNKIFEKLQFVSSKIVIAKSLYQRGYLTDNKFKKLFMQLCRPLPLKLFLKIAKNEGASNSKNVHSFFGASSKFNKSIYNRKWIFQTEDMTFCGGMFPVSKFYDNLLTTLYGDYMILPSESERKCKEHTLLVDFDNSYEKYIEWQRKQKIDTYTRSIR